MNLKKKVIEVEIDGRKYEMALDFESAIEFQELYGKSVIEGVNEITTNQDIKAMACLIASCLKYNGRCVGMEFVKGLDLMTYLTLFTEKLAELMANAFGVEEESNKKK